MPLEVSFADALRRWPELNGRFEAEERPNEPKPASKGRRSKPFWDQAKPIALAWMDKHGCPKRNDWIRSRSAIASSYGKRGLRQSPSLGPMIFSTSQKCASSGGPRQNPDWWGKADPGTWARARAAAPITLQDWARRVGK
jgi:hypothetical protein